MRLLIVDDDASIRETLCLMFRDEGYVVSEAANGSDALKQMRSTSEPMVVLLDMWMPHMGGEETLLAALSHSPLWARLSFIVITANSQHMSARLQSVLKCHDIPLLLKPFDIDALIRLVESTAAQLDSSSARRA